MQFVSFIIILFYYIKITENCGCFYYTFFGITCHKLLKLFNRIADMLTC